MNVRFAEESDLAAVARFNGRLKAGGRDDEMLLEPELPGEKQNRPEGFPVYRRMIIAEDGNEVRAAMLLCHHNIYINGQIKDFSWTKLPLSEGIVDKKYSLAIIRLMRWAMDHQPILMGVGGGTPDSDGFRLFATLRWRYQSIPFFFYPVRVGRVFKGLRYFKGGLRYGALAAAYSGTGAGLSGLLKLRRLLTSGIRGYEYTTPERFDDWADHIFNRCLPEYPVAIRSDAAALNIVYPPGDPGYVRLRVRRKGADQDAGWIVVAIKQMVDNHYFGNLKVGTLVDGFGGTADVQILISSGIDHLIAAGVDIIVANFSHTAWQNACRANGMFSGPSNYQLFVSPRGDQLLDESLPLHSIHVARGHSDGMDNLI